MSENGTLPDEGLARIERLCWHLSGWTVEQRAVDELLAAVQAYAQGAGGALASRGTGDAQTPLTPPLTPPMWEVVTEPVSGPQTPAQSLHVTGTLTLVCSGGCGHKNTTPRKRKRKIVPKAERRRQPPSPDPHDPALPEDYRPCRVCQETKPIGEYVKDSHGRRGRRTICRDCENARKREARRKQRDA